MADRTSSGSSFHILGVVKGYSETDKLDRIHRANAQRHVIPSPGEAQNS